MKKLHLLLFMSLSFLLFYGCFEDEVDKKDLIKLNILEQETVIGERFPSIDLTKGGVLKAITYDEVLSWNFSESKILSASKSEAGIVTVSILDTTFYGTETLVFTLEYEAGKVLSFDVLFTIQTPPVISKIPNQGVVKGTAFTPIPLQNYVTDLDDSTLDIYWKGKSTGNILVNIVNDTATLSIKDPQITGKDSVEFTAIDRDNLKDIAVVYFTVIDSTGENLPPVVTQIPNQTIVQGGQFSPILFSNYVTDDGDVSKITWKSSDATNLTLQMSNMGCMVQPTSTEWTGSESVTFIATDTGGLSDSCTVIFTVEEIDPDKKYPPVISQIPNQTIVKGGQFGPILFSDYVSDPDGEVSAITWTSSAATNLTLQMNNMGCMVQPTSTEWIGSESITFIATDASGLSDSCTVIFTVEKKDPDKKYPPVISQIPNQTIVQGGQFAPIFFATYISDPDGEVSEITWTSSNAVNLTLKMSNMGCTVQQTSTEWIGSESVTFFATDADGLSDSCTVLFTVNEKDPDKKYPPVIKQIPDQTIKKGEEFQPIAFYDYVTDPDGDVSKLQWKTLPTVNLTVTLTQFGTLPNVKNSDWIGSEAVTFITTDVDGLSDTCIVTFTVEDNGDTKLPPIVTQIPDQVIDEGGTFEPIPLEKYGTDPDGGGAPLKWEIVAPAEVNVINVQNVVNVSPADPKWTGTATILFIAIDVDGLKDSCTTNFQIKGGGIVIPPNNWVFDNSQTINTIESNAALIQIPTQIDTTNQVATDTTELLATTADSITVYKKQESVTAKATYGNNLKIGEGLLAGLSEEGIKDSLNANSDLIAAQLKESFPVAVDTLTIQFNDVSFGDPDLVENEDDLFVEYTVVTTATLTAKTSGMTIPINSVITTYTVSNYKEYNGPIPPANWPQTIVDAQ